MNILIITNLYPPLSHGGAERVAWRGAHALSKRGHQVSIFTSCSFSGRASTHVHLDKTSGARVYRFFPKNIYHLLRSHRFPFLARLLWHLVDATSTHAARELSEVIAREHPDVVITHNLKGLGVRLVETIRAHHLPHVHVVHDVQLSAPSGIILRGRENGWLTRSLPQRWMERRMKRLMGSPALVLSPSKYLADFHAERGFFPHSRVEILPNPTPDDVVLAHKKKPSKLLRIFFAGKLERHKGTLFLLDALDAITKWDVPFHVHLVGSGSLGKYVTARVSRDARLSYHGQVLPGHLMELLAFCDVSVAPSLCYENSPMVIYESLHAGVPVVASDIGGVGELIADGKNGYLFEPGNTKQFAQAIEKVYRNVDGLLDKSEEIRKSFEKYSLSHYTDRLEQLLRETVERAMWRK